MRHEITFREDYVEIRTYGTASLEGFVAYFMDVLKDERWRKGMAVLADHRLLKNINTRTLRFDDIAAFSALFKKHADMIGEIRCAAVFSKDEEAKIVSGLWWSITKYHGIKMKYATFEEVPDALAWLRS